jgi:hypothetical protein
MASKLSFFLVVIKDQPTIKYIDFLKFSTHYIIVGWSSGTAIDNNNAFVRNVTQSLNITTSTIFSTVGGLTLHPFTTSLYFRPAYWNNATTLDYNIAAAISTTNVTITLTVQSENRVAGFQGMILFLNPSVITITATQNMSYIVNTFTLGTNYNLSSSQPTFGPNFNSKCILGFNRQKHKGTDWSNTYFTNSSYGNFENLHMDSGGTPPTSNWIFFCFGNGS